MVCQSCGLGGALSLAPRFPFMYARTITVHHVAICLGLLVRAMQFVGVDASLESVSAGRVAPPAFALPASSSNHLCHNDISSALERPLSRATAKSELQEYAACAVCHGRTRAISSSTRRMRQVIRKLLFRPDIASFCIAPSVTFYVEHWAPASPRPFIVERMSGIRFRGIPHACSSWENRTSLMQLLSCLQKPCHYLRYSIQIQGCVSYTPSMLTSTAKHQELDTRVYTHESSAWNESVSSNNNWMV
jgi:hypothetical protein